MDDFSGVKVALLSGSKLLMIQRDSTPGLRFGGLWDFPGGGRENNESPYACMRREVIEELGVDIPETAVLWQHTFPAMHDPKQLAWFLVAAIAPQQLSQIKFGNEGQSWRMFEINEFMRSNEVVPPLKGRFQAYLDSSEGKTTS